VAGRVRALRASGTPLRVVARQADVALSTVQRVLAGEVGAVAAVPTEPHARVGGIAPPRPR
jgi:hypothetical protein